MLLPSGSACNGIGFKVDGDNDPIFYVLSSTVRSPIPAECALCLGC